MNLDELQDLAVDVARQAGDFLNQRLIDLGLVKD